MKFIFQEKRKYIVYGILFLIILFLHLSIVSNAADDAWFYEQSKGNIFSFIQWRYAVWTSRIVIESVMILLLRLPRIVWILLDSCMFLLVIDSIQKLTLKKETRFNICYFILTLLCMLTVPMYYYTEAGGYATTLNYVWPLALGLYVLTKIDKVYHQKKLNVWEIFATFFALLYASNQEQMVALLLGFTLIYGGKYYIENKSISPHIVGMFIFLMLALAFHLTCPGNGVRSVNEIPNFYPEYVTFGLIDKLILGIASMSRFLLMRNLTMVLFLLMITILVMYYQKSIIDRVLTFLLFVNAIILSLPMIVKNIPILNHLYNALKVWESPVNKISEESEAGWIVIVYLFIVLMFITYILLKYMKNNAFWIIIILTAGILSKILVGFSPTIFASGARTVIFLDYCIIVATLYCFRTFYDKNQSYFMKKSEVLCKWIKIKSE